MSVYKVQVKLPFPELANYLLNKRIKPLLVACDIYRPAAIQQLYVVGDSIELRFIQNLRIRISRNCTKCN
jgi:signal recognition particle GTPase